MNLYAAFAASSSSLPHSEGAFSGTTLRRPSLRSFLSSASRRCSRISSSPERSWRTADANAPLSGLDGPPVLFTASCPKELSAVDKRASREDTSGDGLEAPSPSATGRGDSVLNPRYFKAEAPTRKTEARTPEGVVTAGAVGGDCDLFSLSICLRMASPPRSPARSLLAGLATDDLVDSPPASSAGPSTSTSVSSSRACLPRPFPRLAWPRRGERAASATRGGDLVRRLSGSPVSSSGDELRVLARSDRV